MPLIAGYWVCKEHTALMRLHNDVAEGDISTLPVLSGKLRIIGKKVRLFIKTSAPFTVEGFFDYQDLYETEHNIYYSEDLQCLK